MNVKRKLSAILSADAAGYSKLMADDDAATLRSLNDARTLFRERIETHGGRLIDTAGDSVLAEFPSAIEAVDCSVEIQHELAKRNSQLAEHRRMQFRIGINLGDVIEQKDGTIYGDGVNVAARLQQLAEPGGTCLSGTAYDQVEGKLPLQFKSIGGQQVKNIAKPVRVYRVQTPPRATPARTEVWHRLARRVRLPTIGMAALLLLIVAGALSWQLMRSRAPVEGPVLALPNKPSIAVLPFANLSGVAAEDYFVDGLVEDIITQLSHFRELFVIARNSTFQYKGKAIDLRQVGHELGVRYILEGSVRRTTDQIRITAQLVDASTGGHVWASKYDAPLNAIFAVQDRLTSEIAGALGVTIRDVEREHALAKSSGRLTAYDLLLRAGQMWAEISPAEHLKVRDLVERAVSLDPTYARAQAALAFVYLDEFRFKFNPHPDRPDPLASTLESAELAVRLDPADAYTHYALGKSLYFASKLERCEQEFKQAFRLNPNFADAKADFGIRLAMIGREREGASITREAMRLNPHYPRWYHFTFAIEAFQQRQFQRAIDETEKIAMPQFYITYMYLTAANAHLGRMNEARAAMRQLLKIYPEFPNNWEFHANVENLSANYQAVLVEGFRKAGLVVREAAQSGHTR